HPRRRHRSLPHCHRGGACVSWCGTQQSGVGRNHLAPGDLHSGDDIRNVLPGKRRVVARPAPSHRRKKGQRRKSGGSPTKSSAGEQRSVRRTRLKFTLEKESMKCPFCMHLEDRVVDSRESREGDVIRRRRECLKCERRFTSYERIDEIPYMVVKKDGTRAPFS